MVIRPLKDPRIFEAKYEAILDAHSRGEIDKYEAAAQLMLLTETDVVDYGEPSPISDKMRKFLPPEV